MTMQPTTVTVPLREVIDAYERGRSQSAAEVEALIEQARSEAFAAGERAGEAKIIGRIERFIRIFTDKDSVRRKGAAMALRAARATVEEVTPPGLRVVGG